MESKGTLFEDDFKGLSHWHHEGGGWLHVPRQGVLRITCMGSKQGGVGCQAFCRQDFPDHIAIEFDLRVRQSNGLIITFVALRGLGGEDIITGLPHRQGVFSDYVGEDALMRSYHVSVSRYDDDGTHTGVSNWRRNPGLHLMAQGPDLCQEIGRAYHIRIEKDGNRCALLVDGQAGSSFVDPGELPGEIPSGGKVGFRAIGARVIADIRNFKVKLLL